MICSDAQRQSVVLKVSSELHLTSECYIYVFHPCAEQMWPRYLTRCSALSELERRFHPLLSKSSLNPVIKKNRKQRHHAECQSLHHRVETGERRFPR